MTAPFVQAKGFTAGRPDGPPLWIVVHTMEANELPTTAESTAAYFANPPDGRDVSSHYCVDDSSVIQCVQLWDVAWTVGNRPGNYQGINWELAGFSAQTRDEWLDDYSVSMFQQMAPLVRADAETYGIPLERRTVAELKAYVPGITSHNDLRLAFGVTDHTDPGEAFPWDVFLQIMGGSMLTPEQELVQRIEVENTWAIMYALANGKDSVTVTQTWGGHGQEELSLLPYWQRVQKGNATAAGAMDVTFTGTAHVTPE